MMSKSIVSILLVICQLIWFIRLTSASPRIQVQVPEIEIPQLGKIRGKVEKSYFTQRPIYHFLGINYAKSPSGSRRFKAPEEFGPWSGTYNATKMRQRCPQIYTSYYPPLNNDEIDERQDIEDCLIVNIFTPKIPKKGDSLLPVLHYLHGGSFTYGSAYDFLPDFLLEEDIVLVVPQYRLGVLGFLSMHTDDIPGNAGMLDVILGLKWVKKYISYFGGDPESVTVVGQSAGAAAASSLLITPLIQPDSNLFQRMIIQSGSTISTWVVEDDPLKTATIIARILKCPIQPIESIVQCFKKVPPMDLVNAHNKYIVLDIMNGGRGRGASGLVIQQAGSSKFITEHPHVTYAKGNFLKVPIMGGVTRDEGSAFFADIYSYGNLENETSEYFQRNLTNDVLKYCGFEDRTGALTDFYHNTYFSDQVISSLTQLAPGLIDICGVLLLKASTFQTVRSASYHHDSYAYSFHFYGSISKLRASEPQWNDKYPFPPGVAHSDELGYLFRSINSTYNERELEMVKTMVGLWTNFVKTGMPAPAYKVNSWPPMTTEFGPYLRISDESEVRRSIYDEYMIATKKGFVRGTANKLASSYFVQSYLFVSLVVYLFTL